MKNYEKIIKKIFNFDTVDIKNRMDRAAIISGKMLSEIICNKGVLSNIQTAEFKVFSQFGEDGILEYLIRSINIPPNAQSFLEFGVEDYQEANTRFLIQNRNWRGVVFDGDNQNIDQIKKSDLYWRHNLCAVCAFIDIENINELIKASGLNGEIGVLSVDIDGNDYWVWESIHVVSPIIVIAEYNSIFGPSAPITIPYKSDFVRSKAHYSNLYWGASIGALTYLANRKGYSLVGSNSAGNNAFFVRNDYLGKLNVVSHSDAWVDSKFRESRAASGELNFLSGSDRLNMIADMPVTVVTTGEELALNNFLNEN